MNRDCTPECVAYSSARDLNEGARQMGMKDMHCVRLLLNFAGLMSMMKEDMEDEDEFQKLS